MIGVSTFQVSSRTIPLKMSKIQEKDVEDADFGLDS